jgi:hypothetical protein
MRQVRSLAEAFACTVVPILTGLHSEGPQRPYHCSFGRNNELAFLLDLSIAAVPGGQAPKPGGGSADAVR